MNDAVRLYVAAPASVRVIECSPPSWMAQIVLAEKAISAEVVQLDFARGEHRTPELLAKNPRGTIPILCHGDRVVHETLAVLDYLERAFPEPALLPRDLDGLALALTRLHESAALKDAGMALFAYLMRTPTEARDPGKLAELLGLFSSELDRWQAAYAAGPFLVGGELTLADIVVFTYVATAAQLGLELGARWPALGAFTERLSERSSVRTTRPRTWLAPRTDLAG